MSSRNGPIARARRIAAEDEARVLAELSRARREAGLSQSELGRACGMSRWAVERTEKGSRRATIHELASLGAAVGRDVRLRAFPAGDAIRDAGQERLLHRLRVVVAPGLKWRTEVPLPIPGDLRAWDAVIRGLGWWIPVEAETVIDDVQALERKIGLKQRDGNARHLLLLIADTRRNRRALASAPAALGGWPLRTREILAALRAGRDPGAGGVVFL
jgi:transcriptional regulator with XRE-family HTH domain